MEKLTPKKKGNRVSFEPEEQQEEYDDEEEDV